jgi:glucose-6-phosphate isomerase
MVKSKSDAAFAALTRHRAELAKASIADFFDAEPDRFQRFHASLGDMIFDYSKQRVTEETMGLLVDLAKAAEVERRRDAMFSGEIVNPTEGRPALHTALRNFGPLPVLVGGRNVMPDILSERAKTADFAQAVRDGRIAGATGAKFSDIINIGIGGSDLGPAMATRALSPFGDHSIDCHFVSNVDGADLKDTLHGLDPAKTLFIVSSKTFTTLETMTNARSARAWITQALGEAAVGHHFAAVSTKLDLVKAFGIADTRMFGFWDWVGGRYSVWSSIGLPLMIAIGPANFEEFLHGAYEVDLHFRQSELSANIPVLMALVGIWNRNVWGLATHAVIPYDQRLARFAAYLQQLDMESNGKSVCLDATVPQHSTGPVVWGEPGTNGQHAFFQLLHQGTEIVPIDFLVAAKPTNADPHHHDLLLANCLAQGDALMRGRTLAEVRRQLHGQGLAEAAIAQLAPHKVFSGNRPSSTFLYKQLNPRQLGGLIALYEHKIFVQAAIWNINPFDQWGVELGKELAQQLAPIVSDPTSSTQSLNSSTAGLIDQIRQLRRQ